MLFKFSGMLEIIRLGRYKRSVEAVFIKYSN